MGNSAHLSEDFALHWLTERGQSHHDADLGDADAGKSIGKSMGKHVKTGKSIGKSRENNGLFQGKGLRVELFPQHLLVLRDQPSPDRRYAGLPHGSGWWFPAKQIIIYHPIATSKGVRINDFKQDNCMKLAIDWGRISPLTKFWPSISCAWLAPARSNESPSWVMPSRSFKLFSNLQRLQKFRNGCGNSCDFDWFCRFTSRFQEIWHWAGEKLKNLVYMRFCVRLFKLQWMEWSTRF